MVQDIFLTETCSYADVILPASAWPEKDGTVTNTNRQVQMGRVALPLPGEARQDLWIIQDLAARLGCTWKYSHVSEVFTEMASMMPALDNISWERVERENHVTYPTDGPTFPAATWCSTPAFRARTAWPSWSPRNTPRPTRCPTPSIRSSSPPAASSSIGTPAR